MIAVVQRVSQASVSVESADYRASIGPGLCVLLGVEIGDGEAQATWMAAKLAKLRIFRDDQDKMNLSVQDVGGQVLLVSQFTLAGECERGHRPSFSNAAAPDSANAIYEFLAKELRSAHGLHVETGIFGAMMQVALVNDGPVTLIIRKPADSL